MKEALHNIVLWEDDDPNKPEGCISIEEMLKMQKRDVNVKYYIDNGKDNN